MNSTLNIYTQHFGLSERPFSLVPDPAFVYWSGTHTRAYTILEFGLLTRAPITLVTGDVGTGKTTLVRLITGDLLPTSGAVARMPGLRVALMDQHRRFPDGMTLWEIVAGAFGDLRALEQSLAQQAANLEHDHGEEAMEKYGAWPG
jgi:ATPase subunit of ABC transporter with duplicated ATPase domains